MIFWVIFYFLSVIADNIKENISRTLRQPLPEVCKVFWDLQDEYAKEVPSEMIIARVYYLDTICSISVETSHKVLVVEVFKLRLDKALSVMI